MDRDRYASQDCRPERTKDELHVPSQARPSSMSFRLDYLVGRWRFPLAPDIEVLQQNQRRQRKLQQEHWDEIPFPAICHSLHPRDIAPICPWDERAIDYSPISVCRYEGQIVQDRIKPCLRHPIVVWIPGW